MSKGIIFEEKDINEDLVARAEYTRRKLRGVPAFLIDDKAMVGLNTLNKKKIEALLDYTVIHCKNCNVKMRVPKNKGKIRITCPSCSEQFVQST